jgi:hypothetical protein
MTERDHFRDEPLGAALRELEVPEHGPGFESELEAILDRPRARDWRLPLGLAAAAAAVAAVATLVLVGLPGSGSSPALAAQVRTKVAATLAHATSIRGTLVYRALDVRTHGIATSHAVFAMDGRGDLRLQSVPGPEVAVYDAAAGVERGLGHSAALGATGPVFAFQRTGIAPGPPDEGPSDELFLQRRLGSALRALLVSGKAARARKLDFRGRPAWQVVLHVRPNRIYADEDRVALTIDRETGFPLRVRSTLHGAFRSELQVRDLALDQQLPRDEFVLSFPRGKTVLRSDGGFRRVRLGDAAARVGYRPVVPDTLPRGYRLAETAVARRGHVLSLSYRRGFDQLVVTERVRGRRRGDPFAEPGLAVAGRTLRIDAGALRGATGHLVIDARSVPHLLVSRRNLLVTIGGDANEFELIQVARSLHTRASSLAARCRASELRVTAGLQGATGSLAGGVRVRNAGGRACTVEGRPRVAILSAGRPLPLRRIAARPDWQGQLVPAGYPQVVLEPGDVADVRVSWSNWCGAKPRPPLSISVVLPHGAGRLGAALEAGTPRCDQRSAPSTLAVQPFMPEF